MTGAYIPLITAADLGIYLNDSTIDVVRAAHLIERAQVLCQSIVAELPAGAEIVVERVAARAYVATTAARQAQIAAAGGQYGAATPSPMGGVWLSRADMADLRRMATGSSAFSISMLPATYDTAGMFPPWDINGGANVSTATS